VLSFPESIAEIQFETVFVVDSPGRESSTVGHGKATSLMAVAAGGISGPAKRPGSITSGQGHR